MWSEGVIGIGCGTRKSPKCHYWVKHYDDKRNLRHQWRQDQQAHDQVGGPFQHDRGWDIIPSKEAEMALCILRELQLSDPEYEYLGDWPKALSLVLIPDRMAVFLFALKGGGTVPMRTENYKPTLHGRDFSLQQADGGLARCSSSSSPPKARGQETLRAHRLAERIIRDLFGV